MCDGKGPHSITPMRVNVAAISVAIALERARPSRGDPVKREVDPVTVSGADVLLIMRRIRGLLGWDRRAGKEMHQEGKDESHNKISGCDS